MLFAFISLALFSSLILKGLDIPLTVESFTVCG